MKKYFYIYTFFTLSIFCVLTAPNLQAQILVESPSLFAQLASQLKALQQQIDVAKKHLDGVHKVYKQGEEMYMNAKRMKSDIESAGRLAKKAFDDIRSVPGVFNALGTAKSAVRSLESATWRLDSTYTSLLDFFGTKEASEGEQNALEEIVTDELHAINNSLGDLNLATKNNGQAMTVKERLDIVHNVQKEAREQELRLYRVNEYVKLNNKLDKMVRNYHSIIALTASPAKYEKVRKGARAMAFRMAESISAYVKIGFFILMVLYVVFKIFRMMQVGQFDISKFVRPLLLMAALYYMQPMVIAMDLCLTEPLEHATNDLKYGLHEQLSMIMGNEKDMDEDIKNVKEEEGIAAKAKWLLKAAWSGVQMLIETFWLVIRNIFMMLLDIPLWVMNIIPMFIRMVLIVLLPFCVMLSVIPIFKQSFALWTQSYIAVGLWKPIFNLMLAFVGESVGALSYGNSNVDGEMILSAPFFMIIAFLCLIIVPKIASSIVSRSASIGEVMGGSIVSMATTIATGGSINQAGAQLISKMSKKK